MDDEINYLRESSLNHPVPKPRRSIQRALSSTYSQLQHSVPAANRQRERGRGLQSTRRNPTTRGTFPGHRNSSAHAPGFHGANPRRGFTPTFTSNSSTSTTVRNRSSNQRPFRVTPPGQNRSYSSRSFRGRSNPFDEAVFNSRESFSQNRPQSRNSPSKDATYQGMGYKVFEEMVREDSIDSRNIALRLSTERSGFATRLKSSGLHHGYIQMILKLFAKLSKSDEPNQYFNRVLSILINNDFHFRIFEYLSKTFQANYVNKEKVAVDVANTLLLLRSWLLFVTNSSQLPINILYPLLKQNIKDHGLKDCENISEILQEFEDLYQRFNSTEQEKPTVQKPITTHDEEPPDDFRLLSVFPTKKDIFDHDPFVRVNLTSSAYKSTEHYLDVQFRLLREDFLRPLREGINEFVSTTVQQERHKKRWDGVKIYQDVKIEFPLLASSGITYCLRFNIEPLQFVQWESSKRLNYGNLVCLSHDNFTNNFLFASIASRDEEDLRDGFIEVEFLSGEGTAADALDISDENAQDEKAQNGDDESFCVITPIDMKQTYAMAESEAYFEAYRHVLAAMQETRTIPLRQYIVDCVKQADSPRYLRGLGRAATYEFSCIVNTTGNSDVNSTYNVLDTRHWPDAKTLGLDPSQVAAVKSALTQELSIIQGPPGTGKTYVGLMIMKLLLANKKCQERVKDRQKLTIVSDQAQSTNKCVPEGPILIVCYTNHALDQFLEGIASFHSEGLIRVGGRGKNKNVEKYKLEYLKKNTSFSDEFSNRTYRDVKSDMESQREAVEESHAILKASTNSVLGLKSILPVVDFHHAQQLEELVDDFKKSGFGNKAHNKALLHWLGVSKQTTQPLETLSYVIEETLEAVVQYHVRNGHSRNLVFQAINATKSLSNRLLTTYLLDHMYQQGEFGGEGEPIVNPEIVQNFLHNCELDKQFVKWFSAKGFSLLEVKCAHFVWLLNPPAEMQHYADKNIAMAEWIRGKRGAQNSGLKKKSEEMEANILEEAIETEDQRMIDDGDDVLVQVRGKNPQDYSPDVCASSYQNLHFNDAASVGAGFTFDSWQVKKTRKTLQLQLRKDLTKQRALAGAQVKSIDDIFSLDTKTKWRLYQYWVQKVIAIHRRKISKKSLKYNRLAKDLIDLRNRESFEVLKQADVIAMTTTGAAKYREIIYKLPVRIMIVEEAAEVLEAHIVTSMPKTTQHLILIGDHQQLKPSPTVYDLATKYNLDMSLFERMVNNGISCSRLELQHRMRPRIADLIRPHIYKVLRDHESVIKYDDVMGMRSNVFFLSHDHLEDNVKDSKSKVNKHEADFMIGLCGYLLQQGYLPEQITILAAYVGQLLAFKKAIGKKIDKKIRITAVDNFQGEENDIILLSLVRSNEMGKIGFLSIENRVCVALSRAKKGLYCMGNFELLKEKSELWRKILIGLERDDLTGNSMPLQCKNHPETITTVKCQEDFVKLPEGGCGVPCTFRLNCGHVCARSCHPDDPEHEKYTCRVNVEKKCSEGHKTKLKCFQKLRCQFPVEKMMPECEHLLDVPCSQDLSDATCTKPCEKKLECEHTCANVCGVDCTVYCKEKVEIDAACGHRIKLDCYKKDSFDVHDCVVKCNEVLKCGHVCRGSCGKCKQGRLHLGCSNNKCGKVLCCGHDCIERCDSECPPCQRQCQFSCEHSKCRKMCCEPCALCIIKCDWKCEHYQCRKLCHEPCDRPPCDEPCRKILPCGHECIGLCGEVCPKICRKCDSEKFQKLLENEADKETRFLELECGHVFSCKTLDLWMEENNSDGETALKRCPFCKAFILHCPRYKNSVNRKLLLINGSREKIAGSLEEIKSNRKILLDKIIADGHFKKQISEKTCKKLFNAVKWAKSNQALKMLELQYNCLSELADSRMSLTSCRNMLQFAKGIHVKRELDILDSRMHEIEKWVLWTRSFFSEQEKEDLTQERERCKAALELIRIKLNRQTTPLIVGGYNVKDQRTADECMKLIAKYVTDDLFPYTPAKQEEVNTKLEYLTNNSQIESRREDRLRESRGDRFSVQSDDEKDSDSEESDSYEEESDSYEKVSDSYEEVSDSYE